MNTYWLTEKRPCLIYGLRGVIDLTIECTGPQQDLHSGVEGGAVYEPFHELVHVLSQLVDGYGNVKIPSL